MFRATLNAHVSTCSGAIRELQDLRAQTYDKHDLSNACEQISSPTVHAPDCATIFRRAHVQHAISQNFAVTLLVSHFTQEIGKAVWAAVNILRGTQDCDCHSSHSVVVLAGA